MIDRHRAHVAAGTQHQCRKKSVHVVEIRQIEKQCARKQLQPAPGVRGIVAEKPAADPVGYPRRRTLRPAVPPNSAIAGDQKRPSRRRRAGELPQFRNVGWIVLAVAVERRDPGCPRRPDAGTNRRALPAALRMAQQPQLRRLWRQPQDLGGSRIGAAVVHVNDLIGAYPVERGLDFGDQRRDVRGLVSYGDNDG